MKKRGLMVVVLLATQANAATRVAGYNCSVLDKANSTTNWIQVVLDAAEPTIQKISAGDIRVSAKTLETNVLPNGTIQQKIEATEIECSPDGTPILSTSESQTQEAGVAVVTSDFGSWNVAVHCEPFYQQ